MNNSRDLNIDPNNTVIVVGGVVMPAGRGFQPVMTESPARALGALAQCDALSARIRATPPSAGVEARASVPATGPGATPAVYESLESTSRLIRSTTGTPRVGG